MTECKFTIDPFDRHRTCTTHDAFVDEGERCPGALSNSGREKPNDEVAPVESTYTVEGALVLVNDLAKTKHENEVLQAERRQNREEIGDLRTRLFDLSMEHADAVRIAHLLRETIAQASSAVQTGRVSQIGSTRVYTPQVNVAEVDRWNEIVGVAFDALPKNGADHVG